MVYLNFISGISILPSIGISTVLGDGDARRSTLPDRRGAEIRKKE
jgi:hypothetical protein